MTNPDDPAFSDKSGEYADGVETIDKDFIKLKMKFISGLTKREWYAGLAMQGILSGELPRGLVKGGAKDEKEWSTSMAIMAIEFADILIEVLNKPKETEKP